MLSQATAGPQHDERGAARVGDALRGLVLSRRALLPRPRRLPAAFTAIPTCGREALSREPWRFVPDSQPLDDLIVYTTSGTTTGHSLEVLSHPEVAAMYLPLLEAAAGAASRRRLGSERLRRRMWASFWFAGSGAPTPTPPCSPPWTAQATPRSTSTRPTGATPTTAPATWMPARRGLHRRPVAFAALADLPLTTRPRALISTAMALVARPAPPARSALRLPGARPLLAERGRPGGGGGGVYGVYVPSSRACTSRFWRPVSRARPACAARSR